MNQNNIFRQKIENASSSSINEILFNTRFCLYASIFSDFDLVSKIVKS